MQQLCVYIIAVSHDNRKGKFYDNCVLDRCTMKDELMKAIMLTIICKFNPMTITQQTEYKIIQYRLQIYLIWLAYWDLHINKLAILMCKSIIHALWDTLFFINIRRLKIVT